MRPPDLRELEVSTRKRVKHYFAAGLLVIIPLGLAVLVVSWFVGALDHTLSPLLRALLNKDIPGLGLVSALLIVLAAGFLASHVVGQTLLEMAERLLLRIPIFSWVYRTFKQMVEAFNPDSQGSFSSVVMVEFPCKGAWSVGFVTKELELQRDGAAEPMAVVYIPTNHFYFGNYAMFRRSELWATSLTVQEGIQISLSAGAGIPSKLAAKRL